MTRSDDSGPILRVIAVAAVCGAVVTVIGFTTILRSPAAPETPAATAGVTARAEEVTAPTVVTPEPRPTPMWIWSSEEPGDDDTVVFSRRLEADDVRRAIMHVSCDNHAEIAVDGADVATATDWAKPIEVVLTDAFDDGVCDVEVRASNDGGPAGFCAVIEITGADGRRTITTDDEWRVGDSPAVEIAAYGAAPWNDVGLLPGDLERNLVVPDGFVAELVYAVPRSEGSWVSITTDDQGRLIVSDQSRGLFRLTPGKTDADTVCEPIDLEVGAAQGLLCLGSDLYVVSHGHGLPQGQGLYRVRDTDGDDTYDMVELLRAIPGRGGEHGPHGIVQGPDGMLYIVGGNLTPMPEPERSAVPRVWAEDQLLERIWDPRGHAVGVMAPGGWICRTDLEAETWELVTCGFRNCYDIAFHPDGELFTYDADMEWDMGAPWYRPTRLCHAVSGGEFGWRGGTGKFPSDWPDNLPSVVDLGPGSPTGVLFGTDAAFPGRYRDAVYLLDWTFGTMWAVHLEQDGASYTGTREVFVAGRPLPLADAAISSVDGAMYVVLGGRGVPSAVYRIRYAGADVAPAPRSAPNDAMVRRRALEEHHRPDAPQSAIDEAWAALASDDRHIAFAARTALEHQPVDRWIDRAAGESDAATALPALLALARCGSSDAASRIDDALAGFAWEDLDERRRTAWLRTLMLRLARHGDLAEDATHALRARLEGVFPSGNEAHDRDLASLLVRLGSSAVVPRAVALMEVATSAPPPVDSELVGRNDSYGRVISAMGASPPQRQQMHYALVLRHARRGWTPELRDRYFRWFERARHTAGGMSFTGFIDAIRNEALENAPQSQRPRLEAIGAGGDPLLDAPDVPQPEGPGRAWTVPDVMALASDGMRNRNFANGRDMYAAATCIQCHRFAGSGGLGGPDLTGVAARFSLQDLLEATIEPSRVISDQYAHEELVLDDGSVVLGRIMREENGVVTVAPNLLTPDHLVEVDASRITSRTRSNVSPMMPHLLDRLNGDEVLDLLAYILSEGDERSAIFTSP